MGAPTSAILSKIFLQLLEHNHILKLLNKYHVRGYFRYIDDIIIIYNSQTTQTENTLAEFNSLNPKLKFTLVKEINNSINYLDLTITNLNGNTEFNIYRKLATTDLTIHNNSCHPFEHIKVP
jgi:hypothetical protein